MPGSVRDCCDKSSCQPHQSLTTKQLWWTPDIQTKSRKSPPGKWQHGVSCKPAEWNTGPCKEVEECQAGLCNGQYGNQGLTVVPELEPFPCFLFLMWGSMQCPLYLPWLFSLKCQNSNFIPPEVEDLDFCTVALHCGSASFLLLSWNFFLGCLQYFPFLPFRCS